MCRAYYSRSGNYVRLCVRFVERAQVNGRWPIPGATRTPGKDNYSPDSWRVPFEGEPPLERYDETGCTFQHYRAKRTDEGMSERVKHTPGPWKVSEHRYSKRGARYSRPAVIAESGHYITTEVHAHNLNPESTQANVALIAAAPELLEVAEEALDVMELFYTDSPAASVLHHDLSERMRAIIAKAKDEG